MGDNGDNGDSNNPEHRRGKDNEIAAHRSGAAEARANASAATLRLLAGSATTPQPEGSGQWPGQLNAGG